MVVEEAVGQCVEVVEVTEVALTQGVEISVEALEMVMVVDAILDHTAVVVTDTVEAVMIDLQEILDLVVALEEEEAVLLEETGDPSITASEIVDPGHLVKKEEEAALKTEEEVLKIDDHPWGVIEDLQ